MAVDISALISTQMAEALDAKRRLADDTAIRAQLTTVIEKCIGAYRSGNKTLLAGNGGSAADAQHIAAEFVSRFYFDRPGLPSIAMTTDTSILTAIGNDYGYERLFSRQLEAQAKAGDVFFALSTSGRSPNILKALSECKRLGVFAVGFTGESGGEMVKLCDVCFQVPSSDTPRIQECHILLGHIICAAVEAALFPKS